MRGRVLADAGACFVVIKAAESLQRQSLKTLKQPVFIAYLVVNLYIFRFFECSNILHIYYIFMAAA